MSPDLIPIVFAALLALVIFARSRIDFYGAVYEVTHEPAEDFATDDFVQVLEGMNREGVEAGRSFPA